jgi:hypothetical protein
VFTDISQHPEQCLEWSKWLIHINICWVKSHSFISPNHRFLIWKYGLTLLSIGLSIGLCYRLLKV